MRYNPFPPRLVGRLGRLSLALLLLGLTTTSPALAIPPAPHVGRLDAHGPQSAGGFAHRFTWAAHLPPNVQLSFHYGLLQPLLLRGFNAAADVRYGRLIATYSHGQGLDMNTVRNSAERTGGLQITMPYSTGFGLGAVLVDELYALIDFKLHAVEVRAAAEMLDYRVVTIGAELGYRFFLYRGLHIAPVLRYWPRIWSSLPESGRQIGGVRHRPLDQGVNGLFVNVLVGWAFDL